MKTCWQILELEPTSDVAIVKSQFRKLIKQYHPDKCRTPEKERKYAQKTIEILENYETAIKLAAAGQSSSIRTDAMPSSRSFWDRFGVAILLIGIVLTVIIFNIGFEAFLEFLFGLDSMNPFAVFGKLLLSVAMGGFLALLMTRAPAFFLFMGGMLLADKIGIERWGMKLGWFLLVIWDSVIFWLMLTQGWFSNLEEPLDVLYRFTIIVVAAYVIPVALLVNWVADIIRYYRIRNRLKTALATVSGFTQDIERI